MKALHVIDTCNLTIDSRELLVFFIQNVRRLVKCSKMKLAGVRTVEERRKMFLLFVLRSVRNIRNETVFNCKRTK